MKDLTNLRKIAEAVKQEPWVLAGGNEWISPIGITVDYDNGGVSPVEAEFIATFDPPTVLALITSLEQAEKSAADNDRLADGLLTDRDYWEAKLTSLVYSLATEEEVGEWSSMNDIADNLIDHIGGRIQKLEQAVARVRDSHTEYVISEWDLDTNSFKLDEEGCTVPLASLCLECSGDEPIADAEDGNWTEDSDNSVYYPCPTIRALDGEPNE